MQKMRTVDNGSLSQQQQQQHKRSASPAKGGAKSAPSAYIDVTTDSVERHRPGNLPAPAPYVDVEGVDNLQPAYMGQYSSTCEHVMCLCVWLYTTTTLCGAQLQTWNDLVGVASVARSFSLTSIKLCLIKKIINNVM